MDVVLKPYIIGPLQCLTEELLLQNKVAFVTAYGIHQLHIFIFVLAISHVLYCILTLAFGTIKVMWYFWEIFFSIFF